MDAKTEPKKVAAKKPTDPTTVFENKFVKWFMVPIYAALKDIESSKSVYGVKYTLALHQNYDNLLLKKGEQATGLAGRFTVQAAAKQLLRLLFRRIVDDIVEAGGTTSANEIEASLADSVAPTAIRIFERANIGECLLDCPDTDGWVKSQVETYTGAKIKDIVILAKIAATVINCFRGIAWMIAVAIYFNKDSCSMYLIQTILVSNGLDMDLLESIVDDIVVKQAAPRKPKAGAAAATEPAAGAAATEPAADAAEQPDDLAPVAGDNVADELGML